MLVFCIHCVLAVSCWWGLARPNHGPWLSDVTWVIWLFSCIQRWPHLRICGTCVQPFCDIVNYVSTTWWTIPYFILSCGQEFSRVCYKLKKPEENSLEWAPQLSYSKSWENESSVIPIILTVNNNNNKFTIIIVILFTAVSMNHFYPPSCLHLVCVKTKLALT